MATPAGKAASAKASASPADRSTSQANAATTLWEQRFPTFVGGSPSATVGRPSVSALGSRGAAPGSKGGGVTYPLRPGATAGRTGTAGTAGKQQQQQPPRSMTPNEALASAKASEHVPLSYAASSIVPGPAARTAPVAPTSGLSAMLQQRTSSPSPGAAAAAGAGSSPPRVPGLRLPHNTSATTATAAAGDDAPTRGYDRLQAAFERLQGKLAHLPLSQRWEVMSSWLDRYTYDEVAVRLATDAAVLHREVCKQTDDRGDINGLRTAVSFMLLEQLLHVMGHTYPKLLSLTERVRDDMMKSVYISPETQLDLRSSFFVLDDPADPDQQKQLIERFYKRTYYQFLRDTASKLNQKTLVFESTERTKDKQMRILNRVIGYWQTRTVALMFYGWRGYIRARGAKKTFMRAHTQLQEQLEKASSTINKATKDREDAVERTMGKVESLERELEEQVRRGGELQARNDELEAAAQEMNKRFEEDARVKKLVAEIQSLRQQNERLRSKKTLAGSSEAGSPRSTSGGGDDEGETSFVLEDDRDTEIASLREQLEATNARLAKYEASA